MASFFRINDIMISTAAIRSIERDGDTITIEFNDGSKRSIKLTTPGHELPVLDNLTGEVIPAPAGWRVAEYFGGNPPDEPERILYRAVVAFRVGPRSIVEPITYWPCMEGYCALVDPQGVFADLSDDGEGYTDEAGFLEQQRRREQKEAA